MQVVIRDAVAGDAAAVAALYNVYVRDSVATFELAAVPGDAMRARIDEVQARALPWLVATRADAVVGYAYATPWKPRRRMRVRWKRRSTWRPTPAGAASDGRCTRR